MIAFFRPARVAAITIPAALLFFPAAAWAQWSAPINISDTAGHWDTPSPLVFDADGYMHLFFRDWRDGGTWGDGYMYYATNRDGTWTKQIIDTSTGQYQGGPYLVLTPDGILHGLFGRIGYFHETTKPVSGGTWSPLQQIDNWQPAGCPNPDPSRPGEMPTGASTYFLSAAVDSSGGILAVWMTLFKDDFNPRNGLWARYKPLGGAWGCMELIQDSYEDGNWPNFGWVTAHGNDFYATYVLNKRPYYRKRTPAGGWAQPVEIFNKGEWGRLAWSPTGQMAAAWHYDVDGNADAQWFEIFVKFSDDGGQTWTSPYNVSQRTALDRYPEITYSPSGDFHVVWQGFGCDGCRPEVLHKARIGGNWTFEENMTNSPAGRSGLAHNAIQARGSFLYLTYTDTGPDFYEDVFITSTGPQLVVSPTSISHTVQMGYALPNDTATVRNGGPGILHYYATPDAPWLACQPPSGQCPDTLAISYPGAAALPAGSYAGTITVSSPEPGTAPAKVFVTLSVTTVKPDFDHDGDVDQSDFGHFQTCLSGGTIPQNDTACQDALLDTDGDVDAQDFAILQRCISGPNAIAPLNCDK